MPSRDRARAFFGWRVMWAAFVVAIFGWGFGFYGPPVFLHAIERARGWSIALISAAVTLHYLAGAVVIANMPALYRRFGVPAVTKASAACAALGVLGWALAEAPWQLFAATLVSGIGWAGTGGLAINMMVSPWFDRRRPAALSTAYNGASVGGVLFSPIWVALIDRVGFAGAAAGMGVLMVVTLWVLSERYFALTPTDLGTYPDGELGPGPGPAPAREGPRALPGRALWMDRAFVTYVAGFSIGLFAQAGIIAHLVSLLVPAVGPFGAGLAAGLATTCAILGRTLVGWLLPAGADRRVVAALTYLVQVGGCAAFLVSQGQSVPLLLVGIVLFGVGIGNVTSLPPLIAQSEFARIDVPRAVALCTAIGQATYAFAPAIFGALRGWAAASESHPLEITLFFLVAATIQLLAAGAYLAGRRSRRLAPG